MGHESVGRIVALGEGVRHVALGQRVVLDPTYFCGNCHACRRGRIAHCEAKDGSEIGVSAPGTFRRFITVEARFTYLIPDDLDRRAAALTEPLSCILAGLSKLNLDSWDDIVVLGAGPMGLLAAQILDHQGHRGAVVEISAPRRELAIRILKHRWPVFASIDEFMLKYGRRETDVAIDTVGTMLTRGLELLRPRGQMLCLGLGAGDHRIAEAELVSRGLTIVGSVDSTPVTFAQAVDLLTKAHFNPSLIVTHELPIACYVEAFSQLGCDLAARKRSWSAQAGKILLLP
jgi:threonine dehydrogenase-like Zn-dependent dehydrogenase